jgi:hypothetical protein
MGDAVTAAAETINKKALEITKLAKNFNFQIVATQTAELKALIEKASKLAGANPEIDTEEYEYPFVKQSAYLEGDQPAKVVTKIEAVVPAHTCNCDPVKCQCSSSNETVCEKSGTRCEFCEKAIKVGEPLHVAEKTGSEMCAICARILWEKARLKESVAYAVINLIGDACTECDPPFFQFKEALKLVEQAQFRLENFRLSQRAKVAR